MIKERTGRPWPQHGPRGVSLGAGRSSPLLVVILG